MTRLQATPVVSAGRTIGAGFAGRMRSLFVADWSSALFLHYEVEPRLLQNRLPFEMDLWHGRAFVSLVAFTMRGMRFANSGSWADWLCRPVATHEFLNLRTYVRCAGEPGICFLSEWLPNRLSLLCGPLLYALPYRHAKIRYERDGLQLRGTVSARKQMFGYKGCLEGPTFEPCTDGSLDAFLLERYVAFNAGHLLTGAPSAPRVFHVEHGPWQQTRAQVQVTHDSLLHAVAPWWAGARLSGANYSPGARDVLMSAPARIERVNRGRGSSVRIRCWSGANGR